MIFAILLSLGCFAESYSASATTEPGPYDLTITPQGGNLVLTWQVPDATLECVEDFGDRWRAVKGVTSPYVLPLAQSAKFYRLRLPSPCLIRGYIATPIDSGLAFPQTSGDAPPHQIYLPGVEVYLRHEESGWVSPPVLTDLSGRFTLAAQPNGLYRICWRARGFSDGCLDRVVTNTNNCRVHLGTLTIRPSRQQGTTLVMGRVRMGDGSVPRHLEPFANINTYADVALVEGDGAELHRVRVNNFGEYFFPLVPVNRAVSLIARMEKAELVHMIFPEANLGGAQAHWIDLSFPNHPPRLEPLIVTDENGERVRVAEPGQTIFLEARSEDLDSDELKYRWLARPGSGLLTSVEDGKAVWQLPDVPGRYGVSCTVYDELGGYAKSSTTLVADELGVPFSGRVRAIGGAPVPDAQVEVNGRLAVTGAEGYFRLRVPDRSRFVLNIRKPGFGLLSQIYDDAVTGGIWTLGRASVYLVDPTNDIDLTDQRDERNCPGPLSSGLNWTNYPTLARPQWQDGASHVTTPGRLEVPVPGLDQVPPRRFCGPGVRVQIPANALEDLNGQPPAGMVNVQLFTVDLSSPGQMPGDYTVLDPDGTTRVMESFGAAVVEITSGARTYNLKPGQLARVTIPVDPAQLAAPGALPPVIPILFYNETLGMWIEDGSAVLQGDVYVAEVSHFSAINTDLVKVNQSCVRVLSPSLPPSYNLEIIIPNEGGAAPTILTKLIDNSPPHRHVIYNLPSEVNIVLVPIRVDNDIPIGTFVVNTGGPQNPTSPNLPADPYDACSTEVTLTELAVPEEPVSGEFLHGLYSFEAVNFGELDITLPAAANLSNALNSATVNYYAEIDPRDKRVTLADFINENGFGGGGEINVIFANSGDLGFGRNMHGIRNGLDVAAYVSNFGDITTPDSDDAIAAVAGVDVVATVAMEYSRIESQPGEPVEFDDPERVVKFYVYDSAGNRINAADLDFYGARPIPQLCMVCHGGEYPTPPGIQLVGVDAFQVPQFNSREDVKLGSKFLPFDLYYYTFAPAPNDKASQQADFQLFNEDIVRNTPPDAAIDEVITEMYASGLPQDETFVVSGWNSEPLRQQMYRDVVARTCRTCHLGNVFPLLQFDQSSEFEDLLGSVENRVCVQYVMPHAKATYDLFWTSTNPHQPGILQIFGDHYGNGGNGWNGELCGMFIPGGETPVTFYESTIQPIFNTHCTGCHIGVSPPEGLSLSASASYGDLVNVPSTQLPSMDRVTPNNVNQSYLWHKLNDSQGSVGGSGSLMPFGGPMLGASDLNDIMSWINSGAAP